MKRGAAVVLSFFLATASSLALPAATLQPPIQSLRSFRVPAAGSASVRYAGAMALPAMAGAAAAGLPTLPSVLPGIVAPSSLYAPSSPLVPPLAAEQPPVFARPSMLRGGGPEDVVARAQAHIDDAAARMAKIAPALARTYESRVFDARTRMVDAFGDLGDVEVRPKSERSVAAKLLRKHVERIAHGRSAILTSDDAARAITDGVGGRLRLRGFDSRSIQRLVNRIVTRIDAGRLVITEVINFHAANGGHPYLTAAQISAIQAAVERSGGSLNVRTDLENDPHGYTSLHMTGIFDGEPLEVQVRGRIVDAIAKAEHFVYSVQKGKDLSRELGNNQNLRKTHAALVRLTSRQLAVYERYITRLYNDARQREKGLRPPEAARPSLPDELRRHHPELAIEFIAAALRLPPLN